jgi:hypothetical protein
MLRSILTTLFCTILLTVSNGQKLFFHDFEWGNKNWDVPETEAPKTILHFHEVRDFVHEDDLFVEYYLYHKVEHINHEEEVDNNNKKYIPYYGGSDVIVAKARVIKKDSTTIELNDSQILESEDEETGRNYRFFALEGLEIGDVIDFYYVVKKNPGYNGRYTNVQGIYEIKNYQFDLFAPDHLIFAFSLKNDTNNITFDTISTGKNHWELNLTNIPALKEEESAPWGSLRKYLVYKLDENLATGGENIINYSKASQNIYESIYKDITKTELKDLQKFVKRAKLNMEAPLDTNIRKFEDYVKNNLNIVSSSDERLENISIALMANTTNTFGMVKILANAYKILGIHHEVVLTNDRTVKYFDEEFESYHNLDQYLLYFPKTQGYLIPDVFEYRYKLIPAEYMDNKGLFIKEVSLGEYNSGLGKVKYIQPLPYKSTHHNMELTATIDDNFEKVSFDIVQSGLGYYAYYLQSVLNLVSEDIYAEIGNDYLKGIMENLESDDWTFENVGSEKVQIQPLIFKCKATNDQLIEFAGDKYLFKAGLVIGPQVEMYSEDERELPLHDNYKREFVRHIEIIVPDGYEIKNPEVLEMTSDFIKEGEKVLLFESTYRYEGSKLIVDINEYYDWLYFDKDEFFKYREVVNMAADFNKVTLIIGKKE